ncbi:ribosome maturation factor RimM [Dehalococcoidia bacterium]|nr:ribosome maturation factor RimM [Dehalococcoidia bacterium]
MPPTFANPESESQFIGVGRVVRPFGIRGELKVNVLSDVPDRFEPNGALFIKGTHYSIERSRVHKGALILKLDGVETEEAAEEFRGVLLEVPESTTASLPSGTFFHFQILGLKVVTTEGQHLGEVVDIVSTKANDVYVTRGETGEVLIPAIADVIKSVDLERQQLIIEALPGLL